MLLVVATTHHPAPSVPTPVLTRLSEAQLAGEQCVWCTTTVAPGTREHVGWTGNPVVNLYGCHRCVTVLRRRLPVWPETGAC